VLREYKAHGQAYVACACERSKFGPKCDGEAEAISAWNRQCREKEKVEWLPCPKCGGKEPQMIMPPSGALRKTYYVRCHVFGCLTFGPGGDSQAEAVQAWNRESAGATEPEPPETTAPCKCGSNRRAEVMPSEEEVLLRQCEVRDKPVWRRWFACEICNRKWTCASVLERGQVRYEDARWHAAYYRKGKVFPANTGNTITNATIEGGIFHYGAESATVEYISKGTKYTYKVPPIEGGMLVVPEGVKVTHLNKLRRAAFLPPFEPKPKVADPETIARRMRLLHCMAPLKKSRLRRMWAWFRAGDWIKPRPFLRKRRWWQRP